jgi:hypothetical protein
MAAAAHEACATSEKEGQNRDKGDKLAFHDFPLQCARGRGKDTPEIFLTKRMSVLYPAR